MQCSFIHPGLVPEAAHCTEEGTECAPCPCTGPCVHEANPVCHAHALFLEGWDMGHWEVHQLHHLATDQDQDCDGYCEFGTWAVDQGFLELKYPRHIVMQGPGMIDIAASYGIERE